MQALIIRQTTSCYQYPCFAQEDGNFWWSSWLQSNYNQSRHLEELVTQTLLGNGAVPGGDLHQGTEQAVSAKPQSNITEKSSTVAFWGVLNTHWDNNIYQGQDSKKMFQYWNLTQKKFCHSCDSLGSPKRGDIQIQISINQTGVQRLQRLFKVTSAFFYAPWSVSSSFKEFYCYNKLAHNLAEKKYGGWNRK